MEPVPDAVRRRLFPGERVIWFGKSRSDRVLLYLTWLIAAAIAWFGFFIARNVLFSMILPLFVAYFFLFGINSLYVLTDSRAMQISPILPPRVLYLNLIDERHTPVPIKLGWIDGIRFGAFLPTQEDRMNRVVGGLIKTNLSFLGLEDHRSVYDALAAQRAADAASSPAFGPRRS